MEDQDAGRSLHTQTEPLGRQHPVFMNPEDVMLHSDPIDVVLKQVDTEGLKNSWNEIRLEISLTYFVHVVK